jgi:hypothetical protein
MHDTATSMGAENITPLGTWFFVRARGYLLSYEDHPCFRDQTLGSIQDVQLLHGCHLCRPRLDVDLEIDNLEHREKSPLRSTVRPRQSRRSAGRAKARCTNDDRLPKETE